MIQITNSIQVLSFWSLPIQIKNTFSESKLHTDFYIKQDFNRQRGCFIMTYEVLVKSWLGNISNNLIDIGKTDATLDYTATTPQSRELFQYRGGQWRTLLSCVIYTNEAGSTLRTRGLKRQGFTFSPLFEDISGWMTQLVKKLKVV